jgi:acetyl-CoA acetyltransferase
MIAGGVESMSRAPFVMPEGESASRAPTAWKTPPSAGASSTPDEGAVRRRQHARDGRERGVEFNISRADQDRMALARRPRPWRRSRRAVFDAEIVPVHVPQKKGEDLVVNRDEHPRATTLEALAKLKGVVRPDGSVTAGNAIGRQRRRRRAAAGQRSSRRPPRPHAARPRGRHGHRRRAAAHHGHGPGAGHAQGAGAHGADAGADRRDRTQRGLRRPGPGRAARAGPGRRRRARQPNGGAIALGHPLGASGPPGDDRRQPAARAGGRYALCTMCIGVGQGIAVVLERV